MGAPTLTCGLLHYDKRPTANGKRGKKASCMTSEAFSCLLQRVPGVGDVSKFLQGQGFAPALAVDTGFFQYLDNLFLAHARILQGIGKGLAALLESGLDDLEEALFIGQIRRRLLTDVHSDDGRRDFWRRHEAFRRDFKNHLGLRIILDRDGQGAIDFMAWFRHHAFCHFLLDHDDDALDRQLLFQELHDLSLIHI